MPSNPSYRLASERVMVQSRLRALARSSRGIGKTKLPIVGGKPFETIG